MAELTKSEQLDSDTDRLRLLGERFVAGLVQTAIVVDPPPPPEPYKEPVGEHVPLGDWRTQMVQARLESIGTPGLYLDRSPTGAGKSFADHPAMLKANRSLTLLPTHANCRDLQKDLAKDGITAECYPRLHDGMGTPEDDDYEPPTCVNFETAKKALGCGLPVSAAVCPNCSFRSGCNYQEQMLIAKASDHAIATHKRAVYSMQHLAEGKPFIAIHEDCEDMLRPVLKFNKGLGDVAELARQIRGHLLGSPKPDLELYSFAAALEQSARWLMDELAKAQDTVVLHYNGGRVQPPSGWQRKFFWAITKTSIYPPQEAMRTCIALARGDFQEVTIQVDYPKSAGGVPQPMKNIVAVWETPLPANASIWFEDGTKTLESIEKLTGRPVIDKTPRGRLQQLTRTVQIPRDITRRTSERAVARLLRGVLADNPRAERIGVIGHSNHIKAMLRARDSKLEAPTRARIHQNAYFGEGRDRASNEWLECDLIVILGTPRVPPSEIRTSLIRLGQNDAAARDGDWGPKAWQGKTETGQLRVVTSRGYRDRSWAVAHRDIVGASLIQAIGRGRGVCASGVPVVVLSNENVGLPLVDELGATTLSNTAAKAAEVVTRKTPVIDHASGASAESPKEHVLGLSAVSTADVANELQLSERQTRSALAEAEQLGIVMRVGQRGGWIPVKLGESQPVPGIAVPETECRDLARTEQSPKSLDRPILPSWWYTGPPLAPAVLSDEDLLELWTERAAIAEYEGRLPRNAAEALAVQCLGCAPHEVLDAILHARASGRTAV